MKTIPYIITLCCAALLCQAVIAAPQKIAPGKAAVKKPTVRTAVPKTAAPPAPKTVQANVPIKTSQPFILLQVLNGDIYKGWPVLVRLSISHEKSLVAEDSIQITSPTGHWSDCITLEMKNSDGKVIPIPVKPTFDTPKTLNLNKVDAGMLLWRISPEDSKSLAEGKYVLSAALNVKSTGAADAWSGSKTETVKLSVKNMPEPLTEDAQARKLTAFVYYHLAGDEYQNALEKADVLIKLRPEDISAKVLKATVLEQMGKDNDAYMLIQNAMTDFQKKYPDSDPPEDLATMKRRLLFKILKPE